jgi:hypothetical protein
MALLPSLAAGLQRDYGANLYALAAIPPAISRHRQRSGDRRRPESARRLVSTRRRTRGADRAYHLREQGALVAAHPEAGISVPASFDGVPAPYAGAIGT